MKLPAIITAIACVFITCEANAYVERACCYAIPKWYMGASGSLLFLNDIDIKHSVSGYSTPDSQSYKLGYGLSGNVGYRITPFIRSELELSYRSSEESSDSAPQGAVGSSRSTALMGNAYYDFRNRTLLTPYLGVGVGAVNVKNSRFYHDSGTNTDSDTLEAWGLAYQFMAGVSYEIRTDFTPIELTFGYRYFGGPDLRTKLSGTFPGTFSFPNDSHNIELGARIFFK